MLQRRVDEPHLAVLLSKDVQVSSSVEDKVDAYVHLIDLAQRRREDLTRLVSGHRQAGLAGRRHGKREFLRQCRQAPD